MTNLKSATIKAALLMALIAGNFACNPKPDDTKEVAEERNDDKFENNSSEKDAQFLVEAAEINIREINLGKLAQTKGTSDHVKELGKMMVDQHTKSMADLTVLASSKMISIPTTETEKVNEAFRKLDQKSGDEFGKEYSDMMVNGHEDAISLFEKASSESTDMEIKTFASGALPELKAHLENAKACQAKCDKM
jgi:putative membrane protein